MALVFLVLVTPEIVDAIALLIWYVRIKGPFGPGFSDIIDSDLINYGLMRLWVGHALFSTAVVTLIVRARLAGFDESLEEAAADLYAPPGRRFRQITLPLMMPAVLAGGLLAFSLSLDNTIISTFVASPAPRRGPSTCSARCARCCGPRSPRSRRSCCCSRCSRSPSSPSVLKRSGDSAEEVAKTITGAG